MLITMSNVAGHNTYYSIIWVLKNANMVLVCCCTMNRNSWASIFKGQCNRRRRSSLILSLLQWYTLNGCYLIFLFIIIVLQSKTKKLFYPISEKFLGPSILSQMIPRQENYLKTNIVYKQWLWLSWQRGRFQHQRFVVEIQSSAKLSTKHMLTVNCWKD